MRSTWIILTGITFLDEPALGRDQPIEVRVDCVLGPTSRLFPILRWYF